MADQRHRSGRVALHVGSQFFEQNALAAVVDPSSLCGNSTSGSRMAATVAFRTQATVVVAVPTPLSSAALAVIVTVLRRSALLAGSNIAAVHSNLSPCNEPSDAAKAGAWMGPPHWP